MSLTKMEITNSFSQAAWLSFSFLQNHLEHDVKMDDFESGSDVDFSLIDSTQWVAIGGTDAVVPTANTPKSMDELCFEIASVIADPIVLEQVRAEAKARYEHLNNAGQLPEGLATFLGRVARLPGF